MSKQIESEKHNHRQIGVDLDLFMSSEEAPGMPFFLPNGMVLRNELESIWKRKHSSAGYQEIKTPLMLKQHLWEQSGHWEHYQENMYYTNVDGTNYCIKPMNCPGAILVFNHKRRSYRELPIRYAELGHVHRHELSGSLNGLFRIRSFTQDDAHLFIREDQLEQELIHVLQLIDEFYKLFGFQYKVELSTRPDSYMGSSEAWDHAEASLQTVLDKLEISYEINHGDGAFYGPKIDFHIMDSLNRSWQCGTVQLDFQMPIKFNCSYIGKDGEQYVPIMIHRAIFGSVERFIGILIEHYNGRFPLWLAPEQACIIPIADRHVDMAYERKKQFVNAGLRVIVDDRNEKMGLKIRDAEKRHIPYMFIIGDKEMEQQSISVRKGKQGNQGSMKFSEVIEMMKSELLV